MTWIFDVFYFQEKRIFRSTDAVDKELLKPHFRTVNISTPSIISGRTSCNFATKFAQFTLLKNTLDALKKLRNIGATGFLVSATLLAALFIGRKVDRWLETGNFFTVILLFLSVVGLAINFFQMVSNLNNSDDETESKQS